MEDMNIIEDDSPTLGYADQSNTYLTPVMLKHGHFDSTTALSDTTLRPFSFEETSSPENLSKRLQRGDSEMNNLLANNE
jgi:hypothetical protein